MNVRATEVTSIDEPVLHLPANQHGSDFVVGPLLGEARRLRVALACEGFDPAHDRLFCTGNLVDIGPDSAGVAALIQEPWFFAVRGPREERFLSWHRECGSAAPQGRSPVGEGAEWVCALSDNDRERLATLLQRLPVAVCVGDPGKQWVIVHGETPAGLDWQPGSSTHAALYLHSPRHRIAAVHGRWRLLAALRARRHSLAPPASAARAQGCQLAVHSHETSRRGAVIGNQCFLPPFSRDHRIWPLGAGLIEQFDQVVPETVAAYT